MDTKKYKLTEETINVNSKTLHRIEALKDFGNVKKGDKGGFIENEDNLSQNGNCWVYGDAKVYDNAKVYDDAEVYDNAIVSGNAIVDSNTKVYGNAKVGGNAIVHKNAKVCDNAEVCGYAMVYDNVKICGDTLVCEDALVYGDTKVCGNAVVYAKARICGNAIIASNLDYIIFKNWWSSGRFFTWTKSNDMWKVGCLYGTGKELIEKAYKDSELSGREYERIVRYVESIINDN